MHLAPQFSILLPTRNRSFIVEEAILSVINQTYRSWELIIIDNDTSNRTFETVSKYIGDNIRYIRTGDLSMHLNWERGLIESKGNYITVLEDKAQFAPYALDIINQQIRSNEDVNVFVWGYIYNQAKFPDNIDLSFHTYLFDSNDVIQMFLNENHDRIKFILPRMITSCCHRSIIDRCREVGAGLFQAVSPDYTSMFAQLSFFNQLVLIDTPLMKFNNNFSNGNAFRLKMNDRTAQDFITLSANSGVKNFYQYSDINLDIPFNSITSDFHIIKREYGGNLTLHNVNKLNVYKEAINQIEEMKVNGVDAFLEEEQLKHELERYPAFIQKYLDYYKEQARTISNKPHYDISSAFVMEILQKLLSQGLRMAIWGASVPARFVLERLKHNKDNVRYIIDSDIRKQDQFICGIKVYPPDHLRDEIVDFIYITTISAHDQVVEQIESMNIKSKILSPKRVKDYIQL